MLVDLQAKLIAFLGSIIFLGLACGGSYWYGESNGQAKERHVWEEREAKRVSNVATVAIAHTQDVVKEVEQDNAIQRKADGQHEAALEELRKSRDANRTLIAQLGGLRITAAACSTKRDLSSTETSTSSASNSDGTVTGTIALPQEVDEDLQDSADEADRILEQVRTCQGWIRDQGFYGPKPRE